MRRLTTWAVLLALLLLAWVFWSGPFPGADTGPEPLPRAPAPAPVEVPPPTEGPPLVRVDLFEGLGRREQGEDGPEARGGTAGGGHGPPPAAAGEVSGADAPPVPRGRLLGTARGAFGEPLPEIRVEVTVPPSWKKVGGAVTDSEGRFAVEGIPSGVVLLEIDGTGRSWGAETVEVPADGRVEVSVGGPVTLEGLSLWPDGRRADFVAAVPMESLADPLAVFRRLVDLRVAGIRLVTPARDGSYAFEGLPPGEWLVGNELTFSVVRLPEEAVEPVHLDLFPRFLAGRILPEAPLDPPRAAVLAVPPGVLDRALRGSRRRMLDLVLAAWRGRPFPLPPSGEFLLAAPGEGRYSLFVLAEGSAADGPGSADAQEGTLPGTETLLVRPAAKVTVVVPDPTPDEVVVVAVRDDRGVVSALKVAPPPVVLFLPAGPWRVEVHRGGGWRGEKEVLVPASGEVTVTVEDE